MRDCAKDDELIAIGQACLDWLATDVNELERFMALAGYSPQRLREGIGTRSLAGGLVDYFGRNEPLLLAMSANTGIPAQRVMRAWHHLNPQS